MIIEVLTLFPEMFPGPLSAGVTGRGLASGLVTLRLHNLRDYTHDRHRQVDDVPYGGGAGMVLKPEPIFEAVRARAGKGPVILLTPQGELLNQGLVRELASHDDLYLICGRYEGVDERVAAHLVDREISIGDYVLTGGELPAMVLIDAVSRLVTGVLGSEESPRDESFDQHLLEYPHYTRPAEFEGHPVPEVLRSGHHAEIERWRRAQAAERTRRRRPDLLDHQG
ncbi:MAG: tRNA (guanosine(37)-N1)-methyltransferase TrmD [Firmicutes bacterium 13_1_40CM_3_65_11]|nr:MAG: tRNA (guanosine(37)-N1)-methyltransferase TrmD [Candidatus Rokubacteria bacterium 13_1_40CM_4_67_11]OLD07820.1 MAG: tRNA (guanosine(37)-N1)-methyltransferase TrmD [Firmicutes bacterium 13_1_40CM_3_65_11]